MRKSRQSCNYSAADVEGSTLQVEGCAMLTIGVGGLRRRHKALVAEIASAGILRLDFLTSCGGILDIPQCIVRFG